MVLLALEAQALRGACEEQLVPSAMVVRAVISRLHGQLKLLASKTPMLQKPKLRRKCKCLLQPGTLLDEGQWKLAEVDVGPGQ